MKNIIRLFKGATLDIAYYKDKEIVLLKKGSISSTTNRGVHGIEIHPKYIRKQ